MIVVFLIIYVALLIYLIVNFVKCSKNKGKWSRLFIFEIISVILAIVLSMYYDNLPGSGFMPGLTYIGEILISLGAAIVYGVMFVITLFTKIILYLLDKKKQGKNYFPQIAILIAILLLIRGVYTLILDLKNDTNIERVTATIIGYNGASPIVEYIVDNKTYENEVEVISKDILNSNLNDNIEIYYNKKQPSKLGYLSYYENVYIPCFALSAILLMILIIKPKK